jgi:hypothetical protein
MTQQEVQALISQLENAIMILRAQIDILNAHFPHTHEVSGSEP